MHMRLLVLSVILAATAASAQSTPRRDSLRVHRQKTLVRLDSLLYQFDHAPLSAEESERLRMEMADVMHTMEPGVTIMMTGEMMTPGYLGVTFDGPSMEVPRSNERVIRFLDYPRVSMVEPGSPAERGGVAQGDTLLSLNGIDVKDREISLTKLLIPDRRITVRVRREGRPRELPVTVATSPEYMARRMVPMTAMQPTPVIAAAPAPGAAPQMPAVMYAPEPAPAPRAMARTAPVIAWGASPTWVDAEGVAGARLETVTEGLGKALGVKSGVLVMRAAPGTPAYESGLREGDIILRAEGKSVSSARDLRRVLASAEMDDGVHLVILREHRERPITLRW
jgi:hypothetical protein